MVCRSLGQDVAPLKVVPSILVNYLEELGVDGNVVEGWMPSGDDIVLMRIVLFGGNFRCNNIDVSSLWGTCNVIDWSWSQVTILD